MNTFDKREMRMREVFNNAGKQPPSIDYSGAIDEANTRIINFLIDYGEIVTGKQALWALLESFMNYRDYGDGKQQEIRDLEPLINYFIAPALGQQTPTPLPNVNPNPSSTTSKPNSQQSTSGSNKATASTTGINQGGTGGNSGRSGLLDTPVRRSYEWWKAQPTHWKWFWGVVGAAIIGLATVASPILPFFIREATTTPEPTITTEVPEETPSVVDTDEDTEEPIITTATNISEVLILTDTPIPNITEASSVTYMPTTTYTPVTLDGTQQTLPITIYASVGQLAIYIEDNSDGRSLEQLVFIDNNGEEHPIRDYGNFNTYFRFTNSQAGDRCLIILDPTKQARTPQDCRNATLDNFTQTIASVDIFWWQENNVRPFSISNSREIVGVCVVEVCELVYIEPS